MTKTQTLGLIEVTSQRQADNGTQCFHDPQTGCDYISYESGYVRRKFATTSYWSGKKFFTIYQLNKTRKVKRELSWMPGFFTTCTERILEMSADKRTDLICRAAVNYRKHLRKYAMSNNSCAPTYSII
jgi:hypothetical protein